jgi:hypothetical protein
MMIDNDREVTPQRPLPDANSASSHSQKKKNSASSPQPCSHTSQSFY